MKEGKYCAKFHAVKNIHLHKQIYICVCVSHGALMNIDGGAMTKRFIC